MTDRLPKHDAFVVSMALLAIVAAYAAWAPVGHDAARQQRRRYQRTAPIRCQASSSQPEDLPPPPISLRCLSEQEVLDKLNVVPVFAVSNREEELVVTPGKDTGAPTCSFYLELSDALAALSELQAVDPRADVQLTVAPLGTAFALSEWEEAAVDEETPKPLISKEVMAAFLYDDDDERAAEEEEDFSSQLAEVRDAISATAQAAFMADIEDERLAGTGADALDRRPRDDDASLDGDSSGGGSGGSGGRSFSGVRYGEIVVRLEPSQSEASRVDAALFASSPTPPLLRRRNAREGAIPLFGTDLLKFRVERDAGEYGEDAEGAEGGEEGGEGGEEGGDDGDACDELIPLFFSRDDLRAAWVASGGDAASLPPVQLTDLRTLAYQMQFDGKTDYRPLVLVAPESAIRFVERHERRLGAKPSDTMQLSRSELQSVLLGK